MKSKLVSCLLALAAMAFSIPMAFATDEPAPANLCPDADGDGYYAVTKDTNGCVPPHGKKSGDCDDGHASINPAAQEVWDDGINNDCRFDPWEVPKKNKDGAENPNGGDRVSIGPMTVAKFARSLNRSISPRSSSELRLHKDIMACKLAGACDVDYVEGKLKVKEGYRLLDVDCDGVLNVVEEEYSLTLKDQEKCRKAGRSVSTEGNNACPTCPGTKKKTYKSTSKVQQSSDSSSTSSVSTSTRSSSVVVSRKVQQQLNETREESSLALKVATEAGKHAAQLEVVQKGHGEKLSVLDQALAEQKASLAAEVSRATAAEKAIDEKADEAIGRSTEAGTKADMALATVSSLEKQGMFVELSLGGAMIIQHEASIRGKVKTYQMRGNVAPGGYVGLNLGYATEDARFGGFFSLLPVSDDGPKGWESSLAYQGGVEATFKALKGLGFHAMFLKHDAGGSVVGANAYSTGGGGGLSYVSMTRGTNLKVGVQARATVGVESYGAGKGSDTAPFAALSLGVNFGFGPK